MFIWVVYWCGIIGIGYGCYVIDDIDYYVVVCSY